MFWIVWFDLVWIQFGYFQEWNFSLISKPQIEKFLLKQIFSGPKIFWDPKFFGTLNFLGHKIF